MNLKSQYSEIGNQYLNAQRQENESRKLEREAFEEEYQKKVNAIKSKYPNNEVVQSLETNNDWI